MKTKQFCFSDKNVYGILPLLAGLLLLFVPLLSSYHIDSAILAGVTGAFWAVFTAVRWDAGLKMQIRVTAGVYMAGVPLMVNDLRTGCLSADGILFWVFIPLWSILLGFAIARTARCFFPSHAGKVAVLLLMLILFLSTVLTLRHFPQVYLFNHVFGYWPGPIYDEQVSFNSSLAFFRLLTSGWIAFFWLLPKVRKPGIIGKGVLGIVIAAMAVFYYLSPQLGILSTESHIQYKLGGIKETRHFNIYYSRDSYSPEDIEWLADWHEFHFSELSDTLQIAWPSGKKIHSYLYGDEWQMQKLNGAKRVSYVPVWMKTPQMHMQRTAIMSTLRHEMVHVLAREFGNRLLNASWNIGLVEGLAVALDPASSLRLTADEMVAANRVMAGKPEIKKHFSFTGFYRQSSTFAYALSGSLVGALLRNYPVERFKTAYRTSSLGKGYDDVLEEAIEIWHAELRSLPVAEEDQHWAMQMFSVPPLFEKKCPRRISEFQFHLDLFRKSISRKDTLAAMAALEQLLAIQPDWLSGWERWMQLKMERGQMDEVLQRAVDLPDKPALMIMYADALFSSGKIGCAKKIRDRVFEDKTVSKKPFLEKEVRNTREIWEWNNLLRYSSRWSLMDQKEARQIISQEPALIWVFWAHEFNRRSFPVSGGINENLKGAGLVHPDFILEAIYRTLDPPHFKTALDLLFLIEKPQDRQMLIENLYESSLSRVQKKKLDEAKRFLAMTSS